MRFLITWFCLNVSLAYAAMLPPSLEGRVYDSLSLEPLAGATIIYFKGQVASTDANGSYSLWMPPGEQVIAFQYVGYQSVSKTVHLQEGKPQILNLGMMPSVTEMDQVVVSAGRLPQRIAESTVSVSLIRPEWINASHITDAMEVVDKSAGIEVLDGQVSVRGGSGFSYGAGSRVLVLTDGLPAMSTDAGSVRWNMLPLESLSQIEVIKGASSVLYGSSALNGIINLRTAEPTQEGTTRFFLEGGIFDRPSNTDWVWWDSPRTFAATSFYHSRQYGRTGLSAGGLMRIDQGYRRLNDERLGRLNLRLRHRHSRVEGLSYGLAIHGGHTDKRDFLLWEDAFRGALKQQPSTASRMRGSYLFADPFVSFHKEGVFTHDVRMRLQISGNDHPDHPQNSSSTRSLYTEYQAWFRMNPALSINAGLSQQSSRIRSNFYGDHTGMHMDAFAQANLNPVDKLTLVAGLRLAFSALNGQADRLTPLFRAGVNYHLLNLTFLRASFGQGYRYPSIAEKFAATTLGAIRVVPNPNVQPESGWNAELGIKQGIPGQRLEGLLDLALFYGQNSDMLEYIFVLSRDRETGQFFPAFRATNIEHSRVYGIELEFILNQQWGHLSTTVTGGYVFMIPVEFDPETNRNTGDYLKFRRKHAASLNMSASAGKVEAGVSVYMRSRILAIDDIFTNPATREQILPGFFAYWLENNTGHVLSDLHAGYRLNRQLLVSLVVDNLFNTEYMGRPGDIRPHRNFSIRLSGNL